MTRKVKTGDWVKIYIPAIGCNETNCPDCQNNDCVFTKDFIIDGTITKIRQTGTGLGEGSKGWDLLIDSKIQEEWHQKHDGGWIIEHLERG